MAECHRELCQGSEKALIQYENLEGDAAAEHVEQIQWEIDACDEWLPKKADEATARAWVEEAIAALGGPVLISVRSWELL